MSNDNLDNSDVTHLNQHLFNNIQRVPLVVGAAHGSRLQPYAGGDTVLDYWGDEGVCALGYNTPELRSAVARFWEGTDPHQLPDVYPHHLRWQAAEMLCLRSGMDHAFFSNSGTEANEAAIKLARKLWWDREGKPMASEKVAQIHRRHAILTVEGNFHGRTGFSSAASDPRVSPYHRWGFGPPARGFGVIDWDGGDTWEAFTLTVNDGAEVARPFTPLYEAVAAIILAPVLGNNCVHPYPPEFWRALADVREKTGTLLIYDDVQAGMGRAGALATWKSRAEIPKPDIMTLGKGIAMGFPMSAMLATEEVASAFTPGVHFNTFGGSPFVCHMAIEMMKWLDKHQEDVNEKGDLIRAAFQHRDWIREHEGAGMLNAFTPAFEQHGYNGYAFCAAARERGLSLMTHRPLGAIRFTPPLNVTVRELETAFGLLDATHAALAR